VQGDTYELDLLQRAKEGDTVAVTVLLARYHERLRAQTARRIPVDLQRTVDADDILQETQVQVYRHVETFEPRGPDSFYRWVATIALRRLRNAIKRQRAAKRGAGKMGITGGATVPEESVVTLLELMAGPEKTPSRVATRNEAIQAVQTALAHLPQDYRKAVQLVYIEGHSVAHAAAEMGRTDRAIHNLCHKAKKHLQELLGSASRYLSSSG
jgi:RNA polymerase sigma-70 factor (ECF subfamily)